ncbi:hypothetical protein FQN52_005181 [Onygenales sp. PD_12]|nr:hypothetical protein FQN52_005181 [Onygenales sp. PD_12]
MGAVLSCCCAGDREITVNGQGIGSPQNPSTTLDVDRHGLQPIRREDGTQPTFIQPMQHSLEMQEMAKALGVQHPQQPEAQPANLVAPAQIDDDSDLEGGSSAIASFTTDGDAIVVAPGTAR